MTNSDMKVYYAIVNYIKDKSYPPTVRELAECCNRAVSTIHTHLERLERDGLIVREANLPRAIRIIV